MPFSLVLGVKNVGKSRYYFPQASDVNFFYTAQGPVIYQNNVGLDPG